MQLKHKDIQEFTRTYKKFEFRYQVPTPPYLAPKLQKCVNGLVS